MKYFKTINLNFSLYQEVLEKNKNIKKYLQDKQNLSIRIMPDLFSSLFHSIISWNRDSESIDNIWTTSLLYFKAIKPIYFACASIEKLMSLNITKEESFLIRLLAIDIINKKIKLNKFKIKSDKEIIDFFIKYENLNIWIIKTWLIFGFQHRNVFFYEDNDIINSIKKCWSLTKVNNTVIQKIYNDNSPNCTILTLLLWKIKNESE